MDGKHSVKVGFGGRRLKKKAASALNLGLKARVHRVKDCVCITGKRVKGEAVSGTLLMLLLISGLTAILNVTPIRAENISALVNDALIAPDVPRGYYQFAPVSEPGYYETSEYMIGSIAVGIVFLESNGTIDPSTEDWTTSEESNVISEITAGLNWLAVQTPSAGVSFNLDIQYRVPTGYEPINRPSFPDQGLWISEAMTYLGYPGTSYFAQVRDYVNGLRSMLDTDWAYAMFIVDSSNDLDGKFPNNWFAYAYLGGPFLVMTYDNDGYGIGNMDYVTAHETCHIFYATDEYNGTPEISGYLGVQDWDGSGCMMQYANTWWLCTNSSQQLRWRDTDTDGIHDIVDNFPDTTLNPYFPDPTTEPILTYNGSLIEVPYPNNNPFGTGRDVTINTISDVEFRVDLGSWGGAVPTDGVFDEDEEDYTFSTPSLTPGTYTIETRGTNSVGNIETTYSSDTVTVTSAKVFTNIFFAISPNPAIVGQPITLLGNLTGNGQPLNNTKVSIYVGGSFAGYLYTNASGWFKASAPVASPGTFIINVTYSGNETYNPSWHAETLTVSTKLDTKVSFTLSPNPVKVGQTVTLKGNLTDIGGNPIGNAPLELWVKIGAGSWQHMANLSTNATGWFQASGKVTSAGTYQVAVVYRGTSQYNLSYKIETLIVNP